MGRESKTLNRSSNHLHTSQKNVTQIYYFAIENDIVFFKCV